ncbi:MAG: primosomal protein N' [SAR202 cluster bacterium]|mgnify:FL=1|nr:MAG: primosomal protein N' [SAR202 cluster bacterium]
MRYAEVAVDAPVGHSRTFSYSIPPRYSLEPGQMVWVPFGSRLTQGIVTELAATSQVEETRDILAPIEPSPLVDEVHMELARWLSEYYLCSLFSAVSLMLPPGFETQVRSQVFAAEMPRIGEDDRLESLRPETREALLSLTGDSRVKETDFVKLLGRGGERELARLIDNGLLSRRVDLPAPGLSPRHSCNLFAIGKPDPQQEWPETPGGLPQRQSNLLQAVRSAQRGYPISLANKEFGRGVGNALVEKGLAGLEWIRTESTPAAQVERSQPGSRLILTPAQKNALACITRALDDPARPPRSFLLHGVTGSGKTEVYLQAIQNVVDRGQQAIFLVPEISLTPQTLDRVGSRFPGRVALLHSRLTPRQKFDQWWKIQSGEYDVVVGPRSALFAPVPRLGLIVLDEEHEWTYKQEEAQPLYHARTVAAELSQLTGAVVVLGSATPDVETYYFARDAQFRRHQLLELPHRIGEESPGRTAELARVEIKDMRQELRDGNRGIFSRSLAQGLRECVRKGQQAILFLNRRGSAPIVQCRDCGKVVNCSRCSVPLAYHSMSTSEDSSAAPSAEPRLMCHRCNRRSRVPRQCRECGSSHIRQLGIGTQRVVDEVTAMLPGVRVQRWDSDTARGGLDPGETMRGFQSGEIQVLVGTQVVAKGLDVANVTLVGVILADVGLHLPDFRSGERSFGLLCQVAGRAGRGQAPGRVFIQTYSPEHYAIAAAAKQDYVSLYEQEIAFRRQLGNPPFNSLAHLVFQNSSESVCQRNATAAAELLRQKAYAQGLTGIEIVGPAPGMPSRLRGRFRWHMVLRGPDLQRFLEGTSFPSGTTVDVDPVHVL